ncbi:MAG: malate synthase A [Planctomycetota bacterium]|nr:malate synthase A [Planctomycetota bacterium]
MLGASLSAPLVQINGTLHEGFGEILSPAALDFVASLERRFREQRNSLLETRATKQATFDDGDLPCFLEETQDVRSGDWTIDPIPSDLEDRRVEITGPVDRKMIINALNSGANVFMADLEDSTSPTWENVVRGQINLRDAVEGVITYTSPEGREYRLELETATLMVRPRGWHLVEKHILVDGQPISASLLDFGLFFFHNVHTLLRHGTGPYFYLPKLESHLEARLWNEVFNFAQDELCVRRGAIKATVLIETITAAFEMDEILYELREHSAGLNCGRWDYIFSVIKKFRNHPEFVLPDRVQVTMETHFLHCYSRLLIQTCHKRGAHAIGGMAAQIPIKGDEAANAAAMSKVVDDKMREVWDGHDGTWVAHPGLVPLVMKVFDRHMSGANQIDRRDPDSDITARDLLRVPQGRISEQGLRTNVCVGVRYIAAWLRGKGCVPLNHLMEDTATAEISRAQVWQWIHHRSGVLDDGRKITATMARAVLHEELQHIKAEIGVEAFEDGRYQLAADVFEELITAESFSEFLTLSAYELV